MGTNLHVFYGTCPACINMVPCTNLYMNSKYSTQELELHDLLSRNAWVAFVSELTLFE